MKVLQIAHNHPAFHAGGTEIFAKEMSDTLTATDGVTSWFLAAALQQYRTPHPGTAFMSGPDAGTDFVIAGGHFDPLTLSQLDAFGFLEEFSRLLKDLQPDIVHFHHILLFGIEAFAVVRNSVPNARIVMTLHDYYPICGRDGLMMTPDHKPCSPDVAPRCRCCLPDEPLHRLAIRELGIRNALSCVDRFIAPSAFLKSAYVTWGLPDEKIQVIHNGYPMAAIDNRPTPASETPVYDFGFFGHLNAAKGVEVFLDALSIVQKDTGQAPAVAIYGSDKFTPTEHKDRIARKQEKLGDSIRIFGAYERKEVLHLMKMVRWVVVPSIWWENDPLVIQEAKIAHRPILCSDIGGMAERVREGADGFHFRCGDPAALAHKLKAILSGATDLQKTQDTSMPMANCVTSYLDLYKNVLNHSL